MAINTANDRRSALNCVLDGGSYIIDFPLNSAVERYNVAGYYGGLGEADELDQILGIINLINVRVARLERCCAKLLEWDDHWRFLYSAIRDIRREILRGKNQGR